MKRLLHRLAHLFHVNHVGLQDAIVDGHRCVVLVCFQCCRHTGIIAHHFVDCDECRNGVSRVLVDGELR